MKKVSSFLLAAIMVFALATATFAANSPTPVEPPAPAPTPVATNDPTVPVVKSGSIAITTWDGNGGALLAEQISQINGQLLTVFELKGTGPVTLTVPGILAGQNYVILHYTGAGIEIIYPTSIANGSISFNVGSNSPFAIVAVPNGVRSPRTSAV